uniref:Uncharacterized protein n=2 Tax=Myripristis murdjan TaxID=586833 RepID=A0A667X9Q1_9TELE
MKQQFDFSVSASVTFDLDVNSSRSLAEMSQQIMQEVSSELGSFRKWSELLSYGSLVLLAWTYLKAMWYRRRYLHQNTFDNVYITAQFEELDQQLARKGGASVLPITRKEATTYITPLSWRLAVAERRVVALSMLSVLSHMVVGAVLVFLDLLVFWMLDQIQQLVKGDIVARVPVVLAVQVNGSGYASDIFKDVVAAFNILQTGNITVISKKCLVEPTEPHYTGYAVIGFLYGLALLFSVAGGFVQRSRRWICSIFHPEREEERIQFLHDHILEQRRTESRALRMTAALSRAEQAGGGGGGGSSCLRTLLLWLPGGFFLSDLLNLSVVCLFCGEAEKQGGSNMVACPVPQCTGMYCQTCFQSLENKCVLCVGPLTCEEDSQTELDSSDEEQLGAQVLNLPHTSHHRGNKGRKVTKRRVSMATDHSTQTRAQISSHDGRRCRDDTDSDSSRHISLYCDSEHSEADLSGQRQQRDSASDASFHTPRDSLQAIIIHQPNCP